MNKIEAIQELKLYRKEKERLKYLEDKLTELRCQMAYPSHNDVYVDGGVKNGTTEIILDKLIEIERTYLSQLSYCYGVINDITVKINLLEFPYDIILRQFYLEGTPIDDIAYLISYSPDSVKRLKRTALENYCELPELYSPDYWAKRIS